MNKKQKKMLARIIIAAVLMVALHFVPAAGLVRFGLYMVPYLIIGYDILRKAALGIYNRQVFDENFLMAVATVGAIALGLTGDGDYTEAIAVMLFYQIGEWFQSYAVGKSRRNISDLMDIRPDYANIEVDGKLEQVDPDEVEVGTLIVVQPGEKVPIDGIVERGFSTLDTAALTGESVPREVGEGDEIISGCINLSGLLHIRTTREFGESTVSKILDLVENASSRKSRGLHLPVCPGVYPGGVLFGAGAGGAAAAGAPVYPRRPGGLGHLGVPGAHLPCHQLPLRAGDLDPAVLLRRHRRGVQGGRAGQGLQLPRDPLQDPVCGL